MNKIGLIGGGLAVRDLHLPALSQLGVLADVVYVATSTPESSVRAAEDLRNLGAENVKPRSVDMILEDPEVTHVLIAVPIKCTAKLVRDAIAAGKHILAEKPISEDREDAISLLGEAKDAGVKLLAGENFRFQSTYSTVRDLVAEGLIGDVKIVFWNDLHFTPHNGKYAATEWRITGEHIGGYLIDGGTHIVAGLRQLREVPIESVHALSTSVQSYLSSQADTLLINFRYSDGVIGHLALGYGVYDPDARHPKVLGTEGTLVLRPDGVYLVNSAGENKVGERDTDQGFLAEWKLFLDGDPNSLESVHRYTKESADDLAFISAALVSAGSGREIAIDY